LPQNAIAQKKEPKKRKKEQFDGNDVDLLTHAPDGFVADNSANQPNDLKIIIRDDPNPFLKA